MLQEGLRLLVLGMGVVISFLVFLVIVMYIQSWVVKKLNEIYPEPVEKKREPAATVGADLNVIALAIATVKNYTKK